MTEYFPEKKMNILTQPLAAEVVLWLVREQKKYNLLYGSTKAQKVWYSKRQGMSRKIFGSLNFWTSNVDNVKEGFLYSLRNVSAWKRHFKKDSK